MLEAYWLASAFWYTSLVLSIFGIMLAAQQTSVLHLLGKPAPSAVDVCLEKTNMHRFLPLILTEKRRQDLRGMRSLNLGEGNKQWRPRWKMVFIWQCPMMFTSYSVCSFLIGLTLFVCTPLIRADTWNTACNVGSTILPYVYAN